MASHVADADSCSVEELINRARHVLKTDPPASPVLLLAAVNKAIAAIVPDEDPDDAARRLSVEWNNWAIEAGHKALRYYYEDSLDPAQFCNHEEPDHEDFVGVACDLVKILSGDA